MLNLIVQYNKQYKNIMYFNREKGTSSIIFANITNSTLKTNKVKNLKFNP
jgi:hypothetical protein